MVLNNSCGFLGDFSIEEITTFVDDKEANKRYVEGFSERIAIREKEFAAQAKAKKWTKANDDFEYNI